MKDVLRDGGGNMKAVSVDLRRGTGRCVQRLKKRNIRMGKISITFTSYHLDNCNSAAQLLWHPEERELTLIISDHLNHQISSRSPRTSGLKILAVSWSRQKQKGHPAFSFWGL